MITTAHAEDLSLLNGLKEGRREATDEIYRRCYNQVRVMIMKNSGSSEDARDIFQDAMLALYQRLQQGDFNLTCKLSSYLQVMCRNLWRTKSRNVSMTTTTEKIDNEIVDLDARVLERMADREQRNLMYRHFNELSDDCKRILELFFSKTPMKEIAEKLETSEGYIKKRKHVCKSRLMENIQSDPLFNELING